MRRQLAIIVIAAVMSQPTVATQLFRPKSWNGISLEQIDKILSENSRPVRTLSIASMNWGKRIIGKQVEVAGSIGDADVFRLLAIAEAYHSAVVEKPDYDHVVAWHAQVVGDSNFARLQYTYECDPRCVGGPYWVFGNTPSGWEIIYWF